MAGDVSSAGRAVRTSSTARRPPIGERTGRCLDVGNYRRHRWTFGVVWNRTVKASRFFDRRQNGLEAAVVGSLLTTNPGSIDADRRRRCVRSSGRPRQCAGARDPGFTGHGRVGASRTSGSLSGISHFGETLMHPASSSGLVPCRRQPFLAVPAQRSPSTDRRRTGAFITLLPAGCAAAATHAIG